MIEYKLMKYSDLLYSWHGEYYESYSHYLQAYSVFCDNKIEPCQTHQSEVMYQVDDSAIHTLEFKIWCSIHVDIQYSCKWQLYAVPVEQTRKYVALLHWAL